MRNSVVATEQPSTREASGKTKRSSSFRHDQLKVARARQSGHEFDRLLKEYRSLIKLWVMPYFIKGADNSDVIQEAQIGFWKAVRDYKDDCGMSFRNFAQLCINRQVVTAVKRATTGRSEILNNALLGSRLAAEYSESDTTLLDMITDPSADVVRDLFNRHEIDLYVELIVCHMSELEGKSIVLQAHGCSYDEIAAVCKVSAKTIDNALLRARRKLAKVRETGQLPERRVKATKPAAKSVRGSRPEATRRFERIISHLSEHGPVESMNGRAIAKLAAALEISKEATKAAVNHGRLTGELSVKAQSNGTYTIELASAA